MDMMFKVVTMILYYDDTWWKQERETGGQGAHLVMSLKNKHIIQANNNNNKRSYYSNAMRQLLESSSVSRKRPRAAGAGAAIVFVTTRRSRNVATTPAPAATPARHRPDSSCPAAAAAAARQASTLSRSTSDTCATPCHQSLQQQQQQQQQPDNKSGTCRIRHAGKKGFRATLLLFCYCWSILLGLVVWNLSFVSGTTTTSSTSILSTIANTAVVWKPTFGLASILNSNHNNNNNHQHDQTKNNTKTENTTTAKRQRQSSTTRTRARTRTLSTPLPLISSSSTTTTTTTSSNRRGRLRTRVTGYGSSRKHASIRSYDDEFEYDDDDSNNSAMTLKQPPPISYYWNEKESLLFILQHNKNVSAAVHNKISNNNNNNHLHHHNNNNNRYNNIILLQFQPNQVKMIHSKKLKTKYKKQVLLSSYTSSLSSSSSYWTPITGLFGVYTLPTGQVWVWMVHSKAVYELPSLVRIHRVEQLHLQYIPYHHAKKNDDDDDDDDATATIHSRNNITRAVRQEQQRQLALLRQALKDHEWYYVTDAHPAVAAAVADDDDKNNDSCCFCWNEWTTFRLQDCWWNRSLQDNNNNSDKHLSNQSPSRMNHSLEEKASIRYKPWWQQPPPPPPTEHQQVNTSNTTTAAAATTTAPSSVCYTRRPNSRFFWNEAVVEPLVDAYHKHFDTAAFQRECNDDEDDDVDSNDVRVVSSSKRSNNPYHHLLEMVIPMTSAFCGVQSVHFNTSSTSSVASSKKTDNKSNISKRPQTSTIYYDQLLLTRRSRFRAGTRFTKRGADATGAVANYAETEQIVVLWQPQTANVNATNPATFDTNSSSSSSSNNKKVLAVASHVQTRGSIPLRWSSPTDIKTYRPRVRIGTNPLAQARAVRQHLVDEASRYVVLPPPPPPPSLSSSSSALASAAAASSSLLLVHSRKNSNKRTTKPPAPGLVFVNLVDKKSDQGRLGRAMDAVLKAVLDVYTANPDASMPWLQAAQIEHVWFDFHAQVKAGRWDRLVVLLEEIMPCLLEHGYFFAIAPDGEEMLQSQSAGSSSTDNSTMHHRWQIKQIQTGVIRTNCMDCLDRTNVVQSIFGRFVLFEQIAKSVMVKLPLAFKTAIRTNPMTLPWANGEVAHRLLWADNADAISRLYAGTPALKGDFTRTGKRTKKGALDDGMNSLQRYYLNNFLDADRQEGMDLLTGHQPFSNTIDKEHDEYDGFVDTASDSSSASPYSSSSMEMTSRELFAQKGYGLSIQEAARQMLLGVPTGLGYSSEFDDNEDDDRDHVRIKVPSESNKKRKKNGTLSKVSKSNSKRLDLRWLPGDLRSHVRSLALSSSSSSSSSETSSLLSNTSVDTNEAPSALSLTQAAALENVDRRSKANLPWWVMDEDSSSSSSSSSSDKGDASGTTTTSKTSGSSNHKKHQKQSPNTAAAAAVPTPSIATTTITSIVDVEAAAMNNGGYLLSALVAGTQAPLTMASVIVCLVAAVSLLPTLVKPSHSDKKL